MNNELIENKNSLYQRWSWIGIGLFLQTDVVNTMLSNGIRVVVLTDDGVTDKVRSRFAADNLYFEGLRLDGLKNISKAFIIIASIGCIYVGWRFWSG